MKNVHFHIFLIISCSVFLTLSSDINSMFSVRNMIPRTAGLNPELTESVAYGAQLAMDHCKTVFKWDRWNCPESAFSRRQLHRPTKEQAVTHAIVSAGLVHSVARNCSKGVINGCGCDTNFRAHLQTRNYGVSNARIMTKDGERPQKIDWSWGGCSDDVDFGQRISRIVLDDMEQGSDPQAFVNLQNNLVGRSIVRNTMVKRCRCHGLSGSCSLQTCWMQLAPFSKVASVLRDRYKKAAKINFENRSNRISVGSSASVDISTENIPNVNANKLVFLEHSPDYCISNNTTGWPGTKGRTCSRSQLETATLMEKRSCKNLCRKCGHKVRKQKRQITWKCNCVFQWCCEVHCDTCAETVEEFFCQ